MLKLAWRNIKVRPLSAIITLLLFSTGVSIIAVVLMMQAQMKGQFERNLASIDMVVGAKGSPLQLILSSVYHVDFPTGNISLGEAQLVKNNPMVEQAIPVALGDNYKGYRIVGTEESYLKLYGANVDQGSIWQQELEVVIGHVVAEDLGLSIGDEFAGAHGLGESLQEHDEHQYRVVGILAPTGVVVDQLILTQVSSIWAVHEEGHDHAAREQDEHGHDAHDHENHEHDDHEHGEHANESHDHGHDHGVDDLDDEFDEADFEGTIPIEEEPKKPQEKEITALLVTFKAPIAKLQVPRMINENTNMQAASPVFESERLFKLVGVGVDAMEKLAIFILLVSGLSVFFSLLQGLNDRQYELAILRVLGASPNRVFGLIMLEGVLLALIGTVFGLLLSHVGMSIMAGYLQDVYHYAFTGWDFILQEWYILGGGLCLGVLAAVVPALMASKTDISQTLSKA